MLARLDLADGLSRQLQQAGLPVRAGEFLFMQLALATVGGLAGALLAWETFGGPLAALGAAIIGFAAPLVWLRLRVGQRRTAFEQGLPEALDRVTGALRAGYGLEYGFDIVARVTTADGAIGVASAGSVERVTDVCEPPLGSAARSAPPVVGLAPLEGGAFVVVCHAGAVLAVKGQRGP